LIENHKNDPKLFIINDKGTKEFENQHWILENEREKKDDRKFMKYLLTLLEKNFRKFVMERKFYLKNTSE
jgi:hypothetical protein